MMGAQPIAVVGSSGQVARALSRAAKSRGAAIVTAGRPDVDIAGADSMRRFVDTHRPALVINAAAYTAVDKAECDAETARRVNCDGPAALARICHAAGIPLLHISTDYVFDGLKGAAYVEDDLRQPQSVYGTTKAAGEDAIRSALQRHIIVRTAWVYGPDGQNFLKTMLRLAAERDVVRVVAEQHGTPTSADHLAGALLDIAGVVCAAGANAPWGTYHVVSRGETTWHGFAAEIFRCVREAGGKVPHLDAISSAEYPTPAERPVYAVLDTCKVRDTFGIDLPPWQSGVAECVKVLASKKPETVS